MINSLKKEIDLRKNYLNNAVKTIYFGGGTPSVLDFSDLHKILKSIYKNFPIVEKQLYKACIRLADILNDIFL